MEIIAENSLICEKIPTSTYRKHKGLHIDFTPRGFPKDIYNQTTRPQEKSENKREEIARQQSGP